MQRRPPREVQRLPENTVDIDEIHADVKVPVPASEVQRLITIDITTEK
jgi:hypothetical protein